MNARSYGLFRILSTVPKMNTMGVMENASILYAALGEHKYESRARLPVSDIRGKTRSHNSHRSLDK